MFKEDVLRVFKNAKVFKMMNFVSIMMNVILK